MFFSIINSSGYEGVLVRDFYRSGKYNYEDRLLWLEIPKIYFRDYVYNIDSRFNDVNYHIELIDYDVGNNYYVIVGHSGNGDKAYFNNLSNIIVGDYVNITIYGKVLVYVVDNVYYIDKSGYMSIDKDIDSVYLITCSNIYYNKQLVIMGKLLYGQL